MCKNNTVFLSSSYVNFPIFVTKWNRDIFVFLNLGPYRHRFHEGPIGGKHKVRFFRHSELQSHKVTGSKPH